MDRIILHIDMNNFYASVELLTRPDLLDMPVAVGGDPSLRHGIVLAKNNPAKAYGVQTAETLYQAKKKCPNLVILPAHHDLYHEYSVRAKTIYRSYSERCQSFGPDEAWLDVTHLGRDGVDLAQEIQERIDRELGLSVSIGVSWNKTFAKMGSDYKKPHAITRIGRDNYQELLWPLEVGRLLFVGKRTEEKLHSLGILTVGDLANQDPERMEGVLGKNGRDLVLSARGLDDSPVLTLAEQGPAKSIGVSQTAPKDVRGQEAILSWFEELAQEVADRAGEAGQRGRTVRISVRDKNFVTKTRQKSFAWALAKPGEIYQAAVSLFEENFRDFGPVRLLGITLDQLEPVDTPEQMTLFDLTAWAPPQKGEDLSGEKGAASEDRTGDFSAKAGQDAQVDKLLQDLRERFGSSRIQRASDLEPPLTKKDS